MAAFLARCERPAREEAAASLPPEPAAAGTAPAQEGPAPPAAASPPPPSPASLDAAAELSRLLVAAECEEAMADAPASA